ncbi:MAG: aminotransferase class V-fold PLP-dependent enzyme, partial [Clostridia bacterium]|nr:aminotransferase class V-fold PLP-dependent enzyme [Clostridia bacterium]
MIYLDNAATTFPKPEAVYRAAVRCMRECGGNPGRSGHRLSREAASAVYDCREAVAALFGGLPENVVFTLNATYALNLAIGALARPGSRVLISGMEHNAVLRPVAALNHCRYDIFDPMGGDEAVLQAVERGLTPETSLVVCNHVSNLCGLTLPVAKIGALCKRRGVKLVIDASQSAGRVPLLLEETCADVICAPGHKGLYGLQGCGFALFADSYAERGRELPIFVSGGNGVHSLETVMPDFLPERFEAGTLPTPAIASLAAGIEEVRRIGVVTIGAHEEEMGRRLREGLSVIRGVTLYGGNTGGGTVLFNVGEIPSERAGELLDEKGIFVRSGFHCCPLGHKVLGTPVHGAVRASASLFTSSREIDGLLWEISRLARRPH